MTVIDNYYRCEICFNVYTEVIVLVRRDVTPLPNSKSSQKRILKISSYDNYINPLTHFWSPCVSLK